MIKLLMSAVLATLAIANDMSLAGEPFPAYEDPPGVRVDYPGSARKDLVIPDALWHHVLERVGFGKDSGRERLGFTRENLAPFTKTSTRILPLMYDLFADVRRIPDVTGRVSDACLAKASSPSAIAAIAWSLCGVDGRSEGPAAVSPRLQEPGPDPEDSLRWLVACGFDGTAPKDARIDPALLERWNATPQAARELITGMFRAALSARGQVHAAFDLGFLSGFAGDDSETYVRTARAKLFEIASAPWSEIIREKEGPVPDASFELMSKFDRTALARGSILFLALSAEALDRFASARIAETNAGRPDPASAVFEAFTIPTVLGNIEIAGAGNDWHDRRCFIVVDSGGDDTYSGYIATPQSIRSPVAVVVDISGNDKYVGGSLSRRFGPQAIRDPVGKRADLVTREIDAAFGGKLVVAGPDETALIEFLKAATDWALEVREGALWAWNRKNEAQAKALADGVRPAATFLRKQAVRLGTAIGGADEDSVDAFCCARKLFQVAVEGDSLIVYLEDSPGLHLDEGCDAPASLACGFFGVGALFDLGGNDYYRARHCGIGAGLYGAGILFDASGNDEYDLLRNWGIGSGHVGIGVLADLQGDDVYRCASTAQGFGGTLGCGILLDVSGNDKFLAHLDGRREDIYINQSVSMVQGAGYGRRADFSDKKSLGGGIGVLVDGGGDDLYESGAYGQGNAYWWAAGIFEDRGGNDTYHMMQYGLGTAPHFGIGVCVDLAGDDKYNVDFKIMQRLMGHGRDGSVGIFIDGDGDDEYRFTSDSCGHADLNTIALFWERRGNDTYRLIPTRGDFTAFGSVQPYKAFNGFRDKVPSVGIFLDTSGEDRYENDLSDPLARQGSIPNPGRNGSAWRDDRGAGLLQRSIGIDIEMYGKRK